jgi:hypothetical protein
MSGGTTVDYNGLFKETYGDKLIDLIPKESVITKTVEFTGNAQMLGNTYNQPVIVRSEQGFTYSRPNNGAFDINPPSTMKTQNAKVDGYQLLELCGIDYESFYRSDNAASFMNATKMVMADALESFHRRLEIGNLYGQAATGLGTVASSTNVNATTTTLAIATGQWASGLWSPLEGAGLDVYTSAGAVLNTVGAVTVSAIDIVNKTITVTGAAADIAAIDNGTDVNNGYVRFFANGTDGADEAIGLNKILLNTGVLFGINATTYNLWRANTFAVGGALTLKKIQQAVAVAFNRGLDQDVELLVNPATWEQLSTEQVAYRMLDSSYSSREVVNGFDAIVFHSQNGRINVIAHKYVKEGEAYMLPLSECVRVGSTDVTFNIPGTQNGQVFQQSPTQAGYQFRVYSMQQLLFTRPASGVLLTGITYA